MEQPGENDQTAPRTAGPSRPPLRRPLPGTGAQHGAYPPPPGHYPPPGAYGPSQFPPPYAVVQQKPFSTKAILAMVFGGISVFLYFAAPITGPIGAVLGWLGMSETKGPEATHRGWGLALAGFIVSLAMFVIGVLAIIGFIWLFQFIETQERESNRTTLQSERAERAEDDLHTIEDHLYEYYLLNEASLLAGGPVLKDEIPPKPVPADWPRVKEKLRLHDLLTSFTLHDSLDQYDVEVRGRNRAHIHCRSAGIRMEVDYTHDRDYEFVYVEPAE